MNWQPAERVQKNSAGEYRALINGQWTAVAKAQKNTTGEYRVLIGDEIAQTKNTPMASPVPIASPDEAIAGHPITRFALGAAELPMAFLQKAANTYDFMLPGDAGQSVDKYFGNLKDTVQRGRDYYKEYGDNGMDAEGMDLYNIAGQMANPGGLLAMRGLPAATGFFNKVKQGGLLGGLYGTGTVQDEYSMMQDAKNTGVGVGIGAAMPLITGPLGWLGDKIFKSPSKRHTEYVREIVGEENVGKISNALKNTDDILPQGKPSAAEAVRNLPEGSPLQAHQKVTAETPGGISGQFGQRMAEQKAAIANYQIVIDKKTAPMRDNALQAANKNGGIPAEQLISKIDDVINDKMTSDLARKTLNAVKRNIENKVDVYGNIDAEVLYHNIRKEQLGETIAKYASAVKDPSGLKKFSGMIQKKVQGFIDDAIENSGGQGWKDYLKKYSLMMKDIDDYVFRQENMYKPSQQTALPGAANPMSSTIGSLPPWLNRYVTAANYALGNLGKELDPKFDKIAAQRLLNPSELGQALESLTPSQYNKFTRAMTVGGPVSLLNEQERTGILQ